MSCNSANGSFSYNKNHEEGALLVPIDLVCLGETETKKVLAPCF